MRTCVLMFVSKMVAIFQSLVCFILCIILFKETVYLIYTRKSYIDFIVGTI